MRHTLTATHNNIMLRPICEEDLEPLRLWRNDGQNNKFLTKMDYITPEKQRKWFENDNTNPNCYTFAIEETRVLKRIIGSVALYDVCGTSAEYGRFLIGDSEAHGKGIGSLSTTLCLYLGFAELKLQTIITNIHEENTAALKACQKGGFVVNSKHPFANGGYEVELVAERDSFFELHDFFNHKSCS